MASKLAITKAVASIVLETGDGAMRFDFAVPIKGEHTIDAIADDIAKKLRVIVERAIGAATTDNSAQVTELSDKLIAAQVEVDQLRVNQRAARDIDKPAPVESPVTVTDESWPKRKSRR